jgi:hypothetical protein
MQRLFGCKIYTFGVRVNEARPPFDLISLTRFMVDSTLVLLTVKLSPAKAFDAIF